MAWCGVSVPGKVWQGRQGQVGLGEARLVTAGLGEMRPGVVWQVWLGPFGLVGARFVMAWQVWHSKDAGRGHVRPFLWFVKRIYFERNQRHGWISSESAPG